MSVIVSAVAFNPQPRTGGSPLLLCLKTHEPWWFSLENLHTLTVSTGSGPCNEHADDDGCLCFSKHIEPELRPLHTDGYNHQVKVEDKNICSTGSGQGSWVLRNNAGTDIYFCRLS
jgi:hypothetical protein